MTSSLSPFRWREFPRDSIFMTDSAFYKGAKSGLTMGAIQSAAVDRMTARTGHNPGSIRGISARGNLLIEESQHKRSRAPSHNRRKA